uniref:Uncharacterized protein n=1 Tax=Amphimedon queenslandica TaxID=400682 RepID=A0A1X7V9A8_AMPQE
LSSPISLSLSLPPLSLFLFPSISYSDTHININPKNIAQPTNSSAIVILRPTISIITSVIIIPTNNVQQTLN